MNTITAVTRSTLLDWIEAVAQVLPGGRIESLVAGAGRGFKIVVDVSHDTLALDVYPMGGMDNSCDRVEVTLSCPDVVDPGLWPEVPSTEISIFCDPRQAAEEIMQRVVEPGVDFLICARQEREVASRAFRVATEATERLVAASPVETRIDHEPRMWDATAQIQLLLPGTATGCIDMSGVGIGIEFGQLTIEQAEAILRALAAA